MLATLRLFKAVPVNSQLAPGTEMVDISTAALTLPKGFILAPVVTSEYRDPSQIIANVNALYGRNAEELNAAFHKSFAHVRDAATWHLYQDAAMHYLTTYGAENGYIYSQEAVFIPAERLDVPELEGAVRLVVIRGMTHSELKGELLKLLSSGVALSEQSIADVLEVSKIVPFSEVEISIVKNREVQTALYEAHGLVPARPEDFLRFIVYKATGQTQIVRNDDLNRRLKARDNVDLIEYFGRYEQAFGIEPLAGIFRHNKCVFLGLRNNVTMRKIVNRISKAAVEHHKPMRASYLDTVTASLKTFNVAPAEFRHELSRSSIFRKARLAYALQYRAQDHDSILYKVRNGRSWATSHESTPNQRIVARAALDEVLHYIVRDLSGVFEGRRVYVPAGVNYALPSTEKQFTGNLPSGTFVDVPEGGMVVGVHWWNLDEDKRIDLDLSVQDASGKIGWDSQYRNTTRTALYSGDMTDAPLPHGAVEAFSFDGALGAWLVNLNYYNHGYGHGAVPFKIVVGPHQDVSANFTVNPNELLAYAPSVIEGEQKTLGLVLATDEGTRFIFSESSFSSGISARLTKPSEQARKALTVQARYPVLLNTLIHNAGAEFVDSPEDADIDLSLEVVDKSTFLKLLS